MLPGVQAEPLSGMNLHSSRTRGTAESLCGMNLQSTASRVPCLSSRTRGTSRESLWRREPPAARVPTSRGAGLLSRADRGGDACIRGRCGCRCGCALRHLGCPLRLRLLRWLLRLGIEVPKVQPHALLYPRRIAFLRPREEARVSPAMCGLHSPLPALVCDISFMPASSRPLQGLFKARGGADGPSSRWRVPAPPQVAHRLARHEPRQGLSPPLASRTLCVNLPIWLVTGPLAAPRLEDLVREFTNLVGNRASRRPSPRGPCA